MNHAKTKKTKSSKTIATICIVFSFGIAIWLGIWLNSHEASHAIQSEVLMPPFWYIGMRTLVQDGKIKILRGDTTPEEIARFAQAEALLEGNVDI